MVLFLILAFLLWLFWPRRNEPDTEDSVLRTGPFGVVVADRSEDDDVIVGPSPSVVVESSTETVVPSTAVEVIGPTEALSVQAPSRAAWDERGWTQHRENGQNIYSGFYQITHRGHPRMFPGRMVVNRKRITPFIADPPREIKRHPKGPCFRLAKSPWFRVEWRRPAQNVDDAILYVEKVLDEAVNGR